VITVTVSIDGLGSLGRRLRKVADLNNIEAVRPLLEEFGRIIIEDNRVGVLSGRDGEGRPVRKTVYRTSRVRGASPRTTGFGRASGTPKTGPDANLSIPEYQALDGPPLAPRGEESRIIANLVVGYGRASAGWQTVGVWDDVVTPDGRKLLLIHARGEGGLPVRNMIGIRPWGRKQVQKATREWAKAYLKIVRGR
jgi:hypothetical protein